MANIIKVKLKRKKSWVRLLRNFILIGDKVWTNDRFNPSSSYWHSGTQFCVMRVVVVIGISGLYTPRNIGLVPAELSCSVNIRSQCMDAGSFGEAIW